MRKDKRIIRFILCTIIIVLSMSVSVMGCYQKDPDPIDVPGRTPSGTSAPQPSATPEGEVIPTVDRQAELAEARAKNPDTVAWLYIPGVEVDDPVMQAEDNGYYLKLDENGEYSMWGCYYAHCEDHFDSRAKLDTNTVIFGHSASNCDPDGPKFTKLFRYMDADFVRENPYIYLSLDGEDLVFQVAALFVTDIAFDYISPDPTGDGQTAFLDSVAAKNWLNFDGVTINQKDKLLTLSTCCRMFDEANTGDQRLVLMAKLLPEGAVAQEVTVSLVENPEMPWNKVNTPHPCDTEKQRMAQGKWRLLCTGRPSFLLLRLSQKGEKPCEWLQSPGGVANAVKRCFKRLAAEIPRAGGYIYPSASSYTGYQRPSAHTGFRACVGAFCRFRFFFSAGCRSPPLPFWTDQPPEQDERSAAWAAKKNIFQIFRKHGQKGCLQNQ